MKGFTRVFILLATPLANRHKLTVTTPFQKFSFHDYCGIPCWPLTWQRREGGEGEVRPLRPCPRGAFLAAHQVAWRGLCSPAKYTHTHMHTLHTQNVLYLYSQVHMHTNVRALMCRLNILQTMCPGCLCTAGALDPDASRALYVCTCMYVYIHIYMYVFIFEYICIYIHIYMYTYL
jgi:hypothetical protein